ncbi:MAG: DUF4230 domain-containing protein [Ruminococcaceae bacterium]|nr:DUF4230 domain-containing protein [Oscillospiraceae bacterium]
MRKVFALFLSLAVCIICASCSSQSESSVPEKIPEPEITKMRSICELATMECYYHNVAKFYEEKAESFLWFTKDKHFWIEYAGVVTIGIDASLVNVMVEDEKVTITMPPAKVLGCKVDENTLTYQSVIVANGSAAVTAEDQTAAFKEAQKEMQNVASNDMTLLKNAQQRAQKLIEDYVSNLGELVGKKYYVNWLYVTDENIKIDDTSSQENSSATSESAAEG